MTKTSELVKPLIMDQVQTIMDENKNTLINSIKNILPENVEIAPAPVTPKVPVIPAKPKNQAKPI
jgi:hypothetical protein